jgi:hypothetical protein
LRLIACFFAPEVVFELATSSYRSCSCAIQPQAEKALTLRCATVAINAALHEHECRVQAGLSSLAIARRAAYRASGNRRAVT